MPSDTLQFTPQVLHQPKVLIKLYNLDKFLADSSFGFNFRELQKTYFGWFFMGFLIPVMQCKVMQDICGGL